MVAFLGPFPRTLTFFLHGPEVILHFLIAIFEGRSLHYAFSQPVERQSSQNYHFMLTFLGSSNFSPTRRLCYGLIDSTP